VLEDISAGLESGRSCPSVWRRSVVLERAPGFGWCLAAGGAVSEHGSGRTSGARERRTQRLDSGLRAMSDGTQRRGEREAVE
jgi:hypothetical protein